MILSHIINSLCRLLNYFFYISSDRTIEKQQCERQVGVSEEDTFVYESVCKTCLSGDVDSPFVFHTVAGSHKVVLSLRCLSF